jgi:hypothetical protein
MCNSSLEEENRLLQAHSLGSNELSKLNNMLYLSVSSKRGNILDWAYVNRLYLTHIVNKP